MSLTLLLSLTAVLIAIVTYYVKKSYKYFEKRGFPYIKPEFPFGNVKGVGTTFYFAELCQKYYYKFKKESPAVGFFFFTTPVILVTDLDVIKSIMVKDFHNFTDRGVYVNKEIDPLSGHLFAIEGAEWKNMRYKLTPTFTSGKMKMMYGTVLEKAEAMVENLKELINISKKIEMNDIVARFTTDVIGSVAFGLELNCTKNPDSMFYKMGQKVFNPPSSQTLRLMFTSAFQGFAKKINMRFFPKDVCDFFMSTIRKTVDYRETNGILRNDFLNLLLELKNDGKLKEEEGEVAEKLTFDELAAQAFLFFLAGFETSSTTMTFALYELALNQDVQGRLRQEIQQVIAKHNGQITYQAMKEMKYLHMVIDETLRMYPPLDILMRKNLNDYKIPGTNLTIEKNTGLLISAYSIQRDPEIYPKPEKFDPERFSDENKATRHPMAHLPFGAGNRNCIGLRFGYMQTKVGLIALLNNFKFLPSDRTTIPMKFLAKSQTLAPIDRMWLNIEKF